MHPRAEDHSPQLFFRVTFAQRTETDILRLTVPHEGDMLAALYGITGFLHQRQKHLEIFRLLRKRRVNGGTQQIALTGLCIATQPFVVALAVRLWILNHRQPVLHTDKIAELPDSFGAAPEVAKFPRAVQRSGVPNNVIMDMLFVGVGTDDKGMVALREAPGKFIAELVGFLRCDLARFEGLPDLIRDHIAGLLPAGELPVLALG